MNSEVVLYEKGSHNSFILSLYMCVGIERRGSCGQLIMPKTHSSNTVFTDYSEICRKNL